MKREERGNMSVGAIIALAKQARECAECTDTLGLDYCLGCEDYISPGEICRLAVEFLKHLHGGVLPEEVKGFGLEDWLREVEAYSAKMAAAAAN